MVGTGVYEGTRRTREGKFDRRRFPTTSKKKAVEAWTEWRERSDEQEMERARATVAPTREKEVDMAATTKAKVPDGDLWMLMTKTGRPINWFSDQDQALTVAAALEQAGKAAGVTVEFEVERVSKWSA